MMLKSTVLAKPKLKGSPVYAPQPSSKVGQSPYTGNSHYVNDSISLSDLSNNEDNDDINEKYVTQNNNYFPSQHNNNDATHDNHNDDLHGGGGGIGTASPLQGDPSVTGGIDQVQSNSQMTNRTKSKQQQVSSRPRRSQTMRPSDNSSNGKISGSTPHAQTVALTNHLTSHQSSSLQRSGGKLGFIKPEILFGGNMQHVGEQQSGLFNSESQMRQLMNHINTQRSAKKHPFQMTDPKSIDRMHSHIALTNEVQMQFINQAIHAAQDSASTSRFRKYENNGQSILNKLNAHIVYKKESDTINQLTKAAFMKNSFIPLKKNNNHDDLDDDSHNQGGYAVKQSSTHRQDSSSAAQAGGGTAGMTASNIQGVRQSLQKGKSQSIDMKHQQNTQVTNKSDDDGMGSNNQDTFTELLKKQMNQSAISERERDKVDQQRLKVQVMKNRRVMKSKIDAIVATHERVVKDMEYAYSDITDDHVKGELKKRIRRLTEQHHNNHSYIGNNNNNNNHSLNRLSHTTHTAGGKMLILQQQYSQQQSQQHRPGTTDHHEKSQGSSSTSNTMKLAQELDKQKNLLQEAIQKTENENKLYFQAGHKLREKNLNFELQNESNKEQVLDRVLMNYFHQQDLLKEQKRLLKKAAQHKKGAASLTARSPNAGSTLKELGQLLSKFQPAHIRLQLKDVSNSVGEKAATSRSHRGGSMTARSKGDKSSEFIDNNMDESVFKSDFAWKKRQNQTINFAKVCSPAQMVLDFMKQDPNYKKQQSIEAIDFLVQFDPVKAKSDLVSGGGAMRDEESGEFLEKQRKRRDECIMRRMFFFFSNKGDSNTAQRFQAVNVESFIAMFNALGELTGEEVLTEAAEESRLLLKKDLPAETVRMIFNKVTSKKEKAVLNYYEFLEAIRKASVQFYLQRIAEDNIPQPQELFERFFTELIVPSHMRFRDEVEREIIRMRDMKQIDALVVLFEESLKDLFVFASALRSSTAYDFNQIYLGFNEVFEILSKLEFFPNRISKNTIRYIYNYVLSFDQGLDFKDFCACMHLIGLSIIRCPLKHTPISITQQEVYGLQRKCREIQFALFKLKADQLLNKQTIKFVQDLSVFYVHHDFLDIINLQQRIISIKEQNQKQLQLA